MEEAGAFRGEFREKESVVWLLMDSCVNSSLTQASVHSRLVKC